jgi:hypothetical protein
VGTSSIRIREKLVEVAMRHGGYFTAADALVAGYADSVHGYHVRAGDWEKIQRGIYRLAGGPDWKWRDLIVWALWSKDREGRVQGVFCRRTALAVHGVLDRMTTPYDMAVPRHFRKGTAIPPDVRLYKDDLDPDDVEECDGFLVTTVDRTLRDVRAEGATVELLAKIEALAATRAPVPDAGGAVSSGEETTSGLPAQEAPAAAPVSRGPQRWEDAWFAEYQPSGWTGGKSFDDVLADGED